MQNVDSRNFSNIETREGTTANMTPKLTFNTELVLKKFKTIQEENVPKQP